MKITIRNIFSLTFILSALLVGCKPSPTSMPTPSATATVVAPTSTPTPTLSPSPTPTPLPMNGQQTHYDISATVNYYNRFVAVSSKTTYFNKSNQPLNEIVFIIYPTIFQAIYIKSVTLGDGTPITDYRWDSHRMIIPLVSPLMPGDSLQIIHDYELYMPDREGVFGQTGRQLNLSYWFPTIPPYDDDQGWLAYEIALVNSMIVGEHLVFEAADFDVDLQFTDRRENMDIAAGALPQEKDGIIHYDLNLARTFTLSISDIYTIAEREINGVKVFCYTFPEEAQAGEAAADLAVDSIQLYSELYGPYEREVLSVVEADFLHGMEFDGLILLSRGFFMFYNGTPETNLTIITPHETSHQWFFSLVGNNQALEPWLDESLATYSEALFFERYHPELVDWWWENRVDSHNPTGYVNNSIYLEGGYEAYRDSVYLNGAHFMQDLRDTIGDEAFFAFLQAYVREYRYAIADGNAFRRLLSQYTDQDLSNLFAQYFSPSGD